MRGTRRPKFKDKNLEEALQYVTQRDVPQRIASDNDTNSITDSKADIERRAKNVRLANGSPFAAQT